LPVTVAPRPKESDVMKYGLLWLLGIPLPIVLVLWLFFR
jgi:hypothetical protein